jgi:hypothetical protein
MHQGPKSVALLATVALWLGALSAARAQESQPDEAGPAEQEAEAGAEAGVEAEPPSEQEGAVKPDQADEQGEPVEDEPGAEAGEAQLEAGLDEGVIEEEAEEAGPGRGKAEVGLDLGFYYRSDHLGTALDLSPLVSAWYAITDGLDLTLNWGFAFDNYAPEQGESAASLVLGNPFLSVRRVLQEGRTRIWFGIGANIPVSSLPAEGEDGYLDQLATYLTAAAMRGGWNGWLWTPEHFGMAVPLGARMVSEDHLLVGGEAAFYFLIPVDDYRADRSDFYIQVAGDLGFGWTDVATGLRLQGVVNATNADVDRLQSAIGPFVRVDAGGAFCTASFLLNLDEPAGIFGDQDVWGLHLGGGAAL